MAREPLYYDSTLLFETLSEQGRSQEWLAKKTGYASNYVRQIKMGRKKATPEFARKVCAVLQMPLASLFAPLELRSRNDSPRKDVAA